MSKIKTRFKDHWWFTSRGEDRKAVIYTSSRKKLKAKVKMYAESIIGPYERYYITDDMDQLHMALDELGLTDKDRTKEVRD